jgi:tetratricopeptide (TPR) repeat protein
VIGKFIESTPDSNERAQEALDRAIALNPRLSIAHKFYAALEAEVGHSIRAMVRLVEAAARHGNDPELFAGLVHACRYCGLFDQSIAAHSEARRLDPNVPTSLEQTLLVSGDLDRLLAMEPSAPRTGGADQGIHIIALGLAGERERARRMVDGIAPSSQIATFQTWKSYLYAWLDYRLDDMLSGDYKLRTLKIMEDPEAMFQRGFLLCDVGDFENGIEQLQQGVNKGYYAAQTLSNRSQFDRVRHEPVFRAVLAQADEGRRKALSAFRDAGGERLLGSVAG